MFTIELFRRIKPSGLRVDGYGKIFGGSACEISSSNGIFYLSVRAFVGIIRLYSQDRVSHRHILGNRFLKMAGVKSWSIVVNVSHVHQQLRGVRSGWRTTVLCAYHYLVTPGGLVVERLNEGNVADHGVYREGILSVSTDYGVSNSRVVSRISVCRAYTRYHWIRRVIQVLRYPSGISTLGELRVIIIIVQHADHQCCIRGFSRGWRRRLIRHAQNNRVHFGFFPVERRARRDHTGSRVYPEDQRILGIRSSTVTGRRQDGIFNLGVSASILVRSFHCDNRRTYLLEKSLN